MNINNKFKISQDVSFGPYIAKVISIYVTPDNIQYEIAYFDIDKKYCVSRAYEFELGEAGSSLGFKSK